MKIWETGIKKTKNCYHDEQFPTSMPPSNRRAIFYRLRGQRMNAIKEKKRMLDAPFPSTAAAASPIVQTVYNATKVPS